MDFDAVGFFQKYGIEYTFEGTKWNRPGWVNISCPCCFGHAGFHLGFSLQGGYWNCYRCGYHRTFEILLALLGSKALAAQALHEFRYISPIRTEKRTAYARKLELPYGLQPLTRRARRYLESRNFSPDLLEAFWKIQSTGITGPLKYRIYIPIYLYGQVVSWQCRSVTNSPMRYIGQKREKEILSNKETLYGLDMATGRSCVVVEGVTDVWRLGPGAVATFGIKFTPAQVKMLLKSFDQFHIMFDPADPQAQAQAQKLAFQIAGFGKDTHIWHPDTELDPGDFPQDDADAFMREALGRSGY